MLTRKREGQAFVYRPKISEAQYLSRTIQHTFASASLEARHAALAHLISGLPESERADIQRLTCDVDAREGPRGDDASSAPNNLGPRA